MKKLRLLIVSLLCLFSFSFAFVPTATAFDPFGGLKSGSDAACKQGEAPNSSACNTNETNNPISGDEGIVLKATRILVVIIGLISVIMMIVGGFKFIQSGGNPEKITGAKNTIMHALIGLIIAALAQALVSFVLTKV